MSRHKLASLRRCRWRFYMHSTDLQQPRPLYQLVFMPGADMGAVERTLSLAILAVGCLHGDAAVRLEAGYAIDRKKRMVVLEGAGPMATAVARVFVGMCAHAPSTSAFRVQKGERSLPKTTQFHGSERAGRGRRKKPR
jgi:hypothetical protein